MADLGRAGRAGRSDRAGDPLEIERHRHRRAVRVARDHREVARQPLLGVTRRLRAGRREHGLRAAVRAADEDAPPSRGARRRPARRPSRGRQRRPRSPYPARRWRSCVPPCCWARMCVPCRTYRTPTPFGPSNLWAPSETRSAPRRSTSISTYGAAWTASTWSRTSLWAADRGRDLRDRLDRADLVVGEHDRDEDRPVVDRRVELAGIDPAVAVDRQLHDLEPELLQVAQRVADRVMLHGRRHDPVAAGLAGPGGALEREVVGLGAARREDDLAAVGLEAAGHPLVRFVERGPGRPPEAMGRARVPELLGQERQHGVERLAPQWGRGGVIEVDRHGPDCTTGPRPALPVTRRAQRHRAMRAQSAAIPSRSADRRTSSARPISRRRSCCESWPLAQPDRVRRDLDQLVRGDELEGALEGHRTGRRQPQGLIVGCVRMLVSFFSLVGLTSMSPERLFSPTTIPSYTSTPAPMNSSARCSRLNRP